MEPDVWSTIANPLRHRRLLLLELEKLAKPESTTPEVLEWELAQVEKRLQETPEEKRRLVEGYRKELFPDFMMREEMEKVEQRQATAQESNAYLKASPDVWTRL